MIKIKLKCLGSSSFGNCYILDNNSEALIIEAGIPFREVEKALDFNVRKIVGVVISHSHQDHAKHSSEYESAGIPVFKPYDSEIENQVRTLGNFVIKSFRVEHDVSCCGYLIEHSEMGKLLFVTDTEYVKYKFRNLNHILIEVNYSKELLKTTSDESIKINHVLTGHMEIGTTCEFLKMNNNPSLRDVVMLHLSKNNANPREFMAIVEKTVKCPVYVAKKGVEIDLNLYPFQ